MMWPDGRRFAFTIFDDTDWATLTRLRPVYDLLHDLGLHTTKSVWILNGEGSGRVSNGGLTCQDQEYRSWVLEQQNRGFEIALHNVAPLTSTRASIRRGLDEFRSIFGAYPSIHCNHTGCQDNLYWGKARLSGWRSRAYAAVGRDEDLQSQGHIAESSLFWGDLARQHIQYVRNLVYNNLNTLAVCPEMPYYDAAKPYVNNWFASADAANIRLFLSNFTVPAIDALEAQGGLCIAYVHFAGGFAPEGSLHAEFRRRMEYIASKRPWTPTVTEVLDYLRAQRKSGSPAISSTALRRLEVRWLADRGVTKAAHVLSSKLKLSRAA